MVFNKKLKKRKTNKKRDIDANWQEFDEDIRFPGVSIKIPKNVPVMRYTHLFRGRGVGFIPSILLIIALFWLLKNLGYVSEQVFWPALLIAISLYLILRRASSFF